MRNAQLQQSLSCPVCYNATNNMFLTCLLGQHLMCGSCAGQLQGDRCPTCRDPLLKDRNRQLVPFRLVNQLAQEFEHACPNEDCTFVGTAAQLEEHVDQCEHRPDRCTFHSMGCPWHGKARDRPAHEADFNPHAGMFMGAMYRTCQFLESAKTDLHQTRARINSFNREIDNLNGRSEIQMNLLRGIRATVDRAEASAEERLRAVEERLPRRANGDSERTAQRHRKTKLDLRNEVVAEVEAEVEARLRSEYEPKEKLLRAYRHRYPDFVPPPEEEEEEEGDEGGDEGGYRPTSPTYSPTSPAYSPTRGPAEGEQGAPIDVELAGARAEEGSDGQ